MNRTINLKSKDGFTIVELMIALSVLSTILIMSTVILIQIGALYSKGVNSASLQNTSRSIVADVTAALQFSSNPPSPCPTINTPLTCAAASSGNTYVLCIGTVRYSYVLNREMGLDGATNINTPHVLWRDKIKSNSPCVPLSLSSANVAADSSSDDRVGALSGGYDIIPSHMRLTKFKVESSTSTGDAYTVDVWMAYGDSDLVVTSPGGQNTCKSSAGTQFCATSQISSVVTGRLY